VYGGAPGVWLAVDGTSDDEKHTLLDGGVSVNRMRYAGPMSVINFHASLGNNGKGRGHISAGGLLRMIHT
jgi:hypothetical protein